MDPLFTDYLKSTGVDDEHIIKLELDREKNKEYLDSKKLDDYVRSKIKDNDMYYIILDEVQRVDGFEFVLNDFLYEKNMDVYVTGSNSKFLSSDIITELEVGEMKLEFIRFLLVNFLLFTLDRVLAWKKYITYGGLPLVFFSPTEEEKVNYLNKQKDNVYLNDVVERYKISNDKELKELAIMLSSGIGSLTNPLKLYNTFKSKNTNTSITDKTIYNYLNYLEDAFLIEKTLRYDIKGKKYIETPYKYYFTDIGIRNAFIGFRQIEESHIMENIIYIELKRRGYNVDVGVVEIREKSNRKKIEIDFVINKGYDRIYIQSALNIDSDDKKYQELRPLVNVNDFFKKIIIVGKDIPRYKNEKGILIMGIYDFLLNDDSLDY